MFLEKRYTKGLTPWTIWVVSKETSGSGKIGHGFTRGNSRKPRVVRSILQAHAFILNPAKRARVVELMTTQLALKSQEDAAVVYDDLLKFYVFKKPYPTRDGFANVISEVAKSLPKAAGIKYEDVVDNSIMEKLDKSGFIDSLYK